jgi:hypothetical protein
MFNFGNDQLNDARDFTNFNFGSNSGQRIVKYFKLRVLFEKERILLFHRSGLCVLRSDFLCVKWLAFLNIFFKFYEVAFMDVKRPLVMDCMFSLSSFKDA